MPDDINDDFEVDTSELENLPADSVEDTDDATDDDFDFAGLTDDEIAAIEAEEGSDDDETDSDNDGAADDIDTTEDDTGNADEANDSDADIDVASDDDYQQEVATVAEKRTAIDAEFDAKLAELEALGKQYDDGDILDGAYNAAKARLDRELKRIEAREAELVTKEDAIR